MGLTKKKITQVRKPNGFFGKLIAKGMNKGSHAKLAAWGITYISIELDDVILDIGCGGGGNVKTLAKLVPKGKVYGIDYSEVSVKVSKKVNKNYIEKGKVSIKHGSVSSLLFEEETFNIVTGFEAYYFWHDLINDLKEIYRVLKPNGEIFLINEAYRCKDERLLKRNECWAKLGDFKLHTPEEFRSLIQDAGYSEVEIFEEENNGWIIAKGKKE